MKKFLVLVAASLIFAGSLSAQAVTPRSNSDVKVFALELGTAVNYSLASKAANAAQTFALDLGFNEITQAGFVIIKGDTNARSFSLVKVAVFPITDLSVSLYTGADSNALIVGGFGLDYTLLKSSSTSLNTSLAGTVQYLFNNPAEGNLAVGLNLKLGL